MGSYKVFIEAVRLHVGGVRLRALHMRCLFEMSLIACLSYVPVQFYLTVKSCYFCIIDEPIKEFR